jgi:hypothetical protein
MNIIYLIYGTIGLGVLVLLSNIVDFSYLVSKLFLSSKPKTTQSTDKEKEFLTIIGLWYQLKERCDSFNLDIASKKLDEVFPLLNEVLDDEKTA